MIPEWCNGTIYQFGDAVWHHDIVWYLKAIAWLGDLEEPDCGSSFWTSNKRELMK